MTPEQFCYWLQGQFEIGKPAQLDAEQTRIIKNHLALVFVHVDAPDPTGVLGAAHATGETAHKIPGEVGPNWHLLKQTCSVCKTDWYECPHGRDEGRPRC